MSEDKFTTTFWMDFSIADAFGKYAVQDTFNRAFKAWKKDYMYLTDLVLVLNNKMCQWYEKDKSLSRLYNDLWEKAACYAETHLKGEELTYYTDKMD